MELRPAIRRALSGEPGEEPGAGRGARRGFSVFERTHRVPRSAAPDFSDSRGRLVLWPLANTGAAVWSLLHALDQGVVPVLLPERVPPARLERLRHQFPDFAERVGEKIVPRGRCVPAHPNVFLVLLTSGSTGEPKAVAASEASLQNSVAAIAASQDLGGIGETGVLLPLAYSFALVNQLVWAVGAGRRLRLVTPGLMTADALEILASSQTEMTCMVATQLRTLVALGLDDRPLPGVRVVNFAGAPFPVEELDRLRALFPNARLYNNYGCTEAFPRLTCCSVDGPTHAVTRVGRPIGDVELRITGEEGTGPIEFRGSSAAIGRVEATGQLTPFDEWIPSGDLGRLVRGELHVLGRHDQIVKLGGERISLLEIEAALRALASGDAVVWQEETAQTRGIWAILECSSRPRREELSRVLRSQLPAKAWPERIFWTPRWATLPNGKTDRAGLQAAARRGTLPEAWASNARQPGRGPSV